MNLCFEIKVAKKTLEKTIQYFADCGRQVSEKISDDGSTVTYKSNCDWNLGTGIFACSFKDKENRWSHCLYVRLNDMKNEPT